MKKALTLALLGVMMLAPAMAFAASPWTAAPSYSDKVVQKLDFGLKNLLGGWTEIYTEPRDAKKAGTCCIKGLGLGLANAVVYTLGGAIHTATFLIPVDVPLPNNGLT